VGLTSKYRTLILLLLDTFCWVSSIYIFWQIRHLDAVALNQKTTVHAVIAVGIVLATQYISGTMLWIYRARYRLGSREEAVSVGLSFIISGFVLFVFSIIKTDHLIPLSTVIAGSSGALLMAVSGRAIMRVFNEGRARPTSAKRALIFGLGSAGIQIIETMTTDPSSPYVPVGFLDDNARKRALRIRGVGYVGSRYDIAQAVKKTGASALIVAVTNGPSSLFQELNNAALEAGIEIKVLPPLSSILDGKVGFRDLSDINIIDLLGRHPIDTDISSIAGYIRGKTVLITGAGGSIGSELTRQVLRYEPAEVLMLDRDESALHGLQLSISGRATLDTPDLVLGDIRDKEFLIALFEERKPDVVFHAAALKHLPLLEQYPDEAWKSNVLGTLNVLQAAAHTGVEVFVNISTDKAANPESALGYSKRIAERITAAVDAENPGRYVSVRFGNVLGSRGSVLATFANQIAAGGPITITHPDVTRYFMTIPEAVQLVIQAAAFGESGDALVLDMGEPISILLVAEQLIEQAQRPINIVYTGLRKGEKLHEDLFSNNEKGLPTQHKLITQVKVPMININEHIESINEVVSHNKLQATAMQSLDGESH